MKRVELRATGVSVSAMGFGCAGIMQSPSRRHRMALLEAAFESGITHFDVARMYGLGMAEGELGSFVQSVGRDAVTVATKFGIDAAGAAGKLGKLQGPARFLVQKAPALRRAVRRRSAAFATPRAYDTAVARRSLDQSLTALGLDYVDILFLHAPRPGDQVAAEDLTQFFEEAHSAGKIRAWGVSQDEGLEVDFAERFAPKGLRQVASDLLTPAPGIADITFGVLGRALPVLQSALRDDAELLAKWRAELGLDPLAGGQLATLVLQDAVASSATTAVLYSSTDAARIRQAANAVSTPADAALLARFNALAQPFVSKAG